MNEWSRDLVSSWPSKEFLHASMTVSGPELRHSQRRVAYTTIIPFVEGVWNVPCHAYYYLVPVVYPCNGLDVSTVLRTSEYVL